jgi:predicted enzyme related to lactoylglutathione lyase
MAKSRTLAKSTRKPAAKGKSPAKRRAATKRTTSARKPASKPAPKRARATAKAPTPLAIRPGVITHTEFASADPPATKAWCAKVLGWKFGAAVPTPTGPYHIWRFPNDTGGGIRASNPPEAPGSVPYCEVRNIRATFRKALDAGAREVVPPQQLPDGTGWIAIVAAPGGPPIGFWSSK